MNDVAMSEGRSAQHMALEMQCPYKTAPSYLAWSRQVSWLCYYNSYSVYVNKLTLHEIIITVKGIAIYHSVAISNLFFVRIYG